MSAIVIDDQARRGLLKEALIEVIRERPERLATMLAEAIEEVGLAEPIRAGRQTATVDRDDVLRALESLSVKVEFRSRFLKDIKALKDRSLKERINPAIAQVESAANLQAVANLKKLKGACRLRRGNGYFRAMSALPRDLPLPAVTNRRAASTTRWPVTISRLAQNA